MVGGDPVLEAMDPAGIFRHVAPDGANTLTGRIGGIVKPSPTHRLGDPVVDHTGLHRHPLVVHIHRQDLVHGGGDDKNRIL